MSEHISRDIFKYITQRAVNSTLGVWKMGKTRLIIHQVQINEIMLGNAELGYPNLILRFLLSLRLHLEDLSNNGDRVSPN